MYRNGTYKRILPSPSSIEFVSTEGKQLFREAINSETMGGYFNLISNFRRHSELRHSGLSSLTMVLNALASAPGRKWKGQCRWFDESTLDCCEPLEKVKDEGIAFGKVVCLARCAGAKVEAFRSNQSNIDEFRKFVMTCCTSNNCHVISSYDKSFFKQTGADHFSPIGGYHAEKDMALILDFSRFKYPPYWVPLPLVWKAMDTVDKATGLHRGFMLISTLDKTPALLFTLSCKHESWVSIVKFLMEEVPVLLGSDNVKDIKDVLSTIFSSLPSDCFEFFKWIAEVRRQEDGNDKLSEEEKGRLAAKEEVLKQLRETDLYKHVTDILSSEKSICTIKANLSQVDNLSNIVASGFCQMAALLEGNSSMLDKFCCQETCVRHYRETGKRLVTVVSGVVATGSGERSFDMLVPSSQGQVDCCNHPSSNDILTALLLALPSQTWLGIKEPKVLHDIQSLSSCDNLPLMLQEEMLHLRGQLVLLKRCVDNKVEEDLGAPSL